ncbi:PLP-dependent transferase [Gonapodya prolifera JEL478]|uniref:PLP-dependent transferase n=1 Tax=Gonapodya prolifera (strain JEL478) TaxID=1344416 RepID=A0A139AYD2_GONPJ|nr:PLP-dependent transferase [Gonapodya prolifera JEL478]|eukprot:KXS21758.1 PLP-dependent transferase [Gonapodya prolifera JEL478]
MAPIADYTPYLSSRSRRRGPVATIAVIQPYIGRSDIISLGGGLPHPDSFPFKSLSFEIETEGGGSETLHVEQTDLLRGLQYGNPKGATELNNWFKGLMKRDHSPPGAFDLLIAGASQDGLAKTLEMLLDEEDSILIEQPTYPATLNILQPLSLHYVPISIDRDGLVPEEIDRTFQNWETDERNKGKRRPRVLYVVPCGQNPSGVNMTLERKLEVYALAQKWDFLIVEDDPYYYLQFTSTHRIPSFLSMDVDARVVRMDSLAKIVSAGIRVGWVTASPALISQLEYHQACSNQHASGIAQALTWTLFKKWGYEGFDAHVEWVWKMYAERGKWFYKACKEELEDKGLGFMEEPQAGMFAWVQLNLPPSTPSTQPLLLTYGAPVKKVLFVPGSACYFDGRPSLHVRASFSMATEANMREGLRRLGEIVKEAKEGKIRVVVGEHGEDTVASVQE